MRSLAPDADDGPRAAILALVTNSPGIHLRGIAHETGLALGQVLHHVARLERMGLVGSTRDIGFRRFYPVKTVGRVEKPILAALRHDVPRRILLELLNGEPRTHGQLVATLDVAPSTMSNHLGRLVRAGVVDRDRASGSALYAPRHPDIVRHELVSYGPSFQDAAVDRFVEGNRGPLGGP